MSERKIVIVGGGQAGGRVALTLRDLGFEGAVTIVADEPHPPYERPPLSKGILTGAEQPDGLFLEPADGWPTRRIEIMAGVKATAFDTSARHLTMSDGRMLAFDDLVIATGARPRRLAVADDVAGVVYLRSMADALSLRGKLTAGRRLVVVGAGVIGLELSSSARTLGVEVDIVDVAPRVMVRQVGPAASLAIQRRHEAAGSRFHLGQTVDAVESSADRVVLSTSAGTRLECDLALVAIGVVPDDALAANAGIACRDGIIVDAAGRTSHPHVWAVGDVARHPAAWSSDPVRQETWRHADRHARAVAAAILGGAADYAEVPGFWSDQFGSRLQGEGVCTGVEVFRPDEGGGFAALHHEAGRLTGCIVLDNPKVAALARKALARGAVIDPASLADPETELKGLLR